MAVAPDRIGTFGTDGNLTNTANWSGGVNPISSDVILMHNNSTNPITSNLNMLDIDLDHLRVGPSWAVNVGASGTPLKLGVNNAAAVGTATFVYEGTGAEFWHGGNTTNNTVKRVIAAHRTRGLNAFVLGESTCTYTELHLLSGRTTLGGAGSYTTIHVAAPNNATGDPYVVINSGAVVATLRQSGGYCESNTTDVLTTLELSGGHLKNVAGNITTAFVSGGILQLDDGDIATLYLFGGTLDLSRSANTRIITTCFLYPGARIVPATTAAVTITTLVDLTAQFAPLGQEIAL
jgi:hypothetical protein